MDDKGMASKANEWRIDRGMMSVKSFWSIAIAVMIILCAGLAGCGGEAGKPSSDSSSKASTQMVSQEKGTCSFTLASDQWDTAVDGSIVVKVEGMTSEGKAFSEKYRAIPGQKYDLDILAGEYIVSLDTGMPAKGSNVFACAPEEVSFDGVTDAHVVLAIRLDAEAMAAAQQAEAARLAAEAAQKEAEERAAAERAAAEAEAARIAQEQAAQRAAAESQYSVYIAASGNGKKYHTSSSCSGMKGTISMSIAEATAKGYTPCKKCA